MEGLLPLLAFAFASEHALALVLTVLTKLPVLELAMLHLPMTNMASHHAMSPMTNTIVSMSSVGSMCEVRGTIGGSSSSSTSC